MKKFACVLLLTLPSPALAVGSVFFPETTAPQDVKITVTKDEYRAQWTEIFGCFWVARNFLPVLAGKFRYQALLAGYEDKEQGWYWNSVADRYEGLAENMLGTQKTMFSPWCYEDKSGTLVMNQTELSVQFLPAK